VFVSRTNGWIVDLRIGELPERRILQCIPSSPPYICKKELNRVSQDERCSPLAYAMAHVSDFSFSTVKVLLSEIISGTCAETDIDNVMYLRRRLYLNKDITDVYAIVRNWDGAALAFSGSGGGVLLWYPLCHLQFQNGYAPHGWFKLPLNAQEDEGETAIFRLFSFPEFNHSGERADKELVRLLATPVRYNFSAEELSSNRNASFLKIDHGTGDISVTTCLESSLFVQTKRGLRLVVGERHFAIRCPNIKQYERLRNRANKYFASDLDEISRGIGREMISDPL